MSGVPLETCWAFSEWWNNDFCYKVASCWLFLLNLSSLLSDILWYQFHVRHIVFHQNNAHL